MHKVYIQTDKNNNIIKVDSSVFLKDAIGWFKIDEGEGDKYAHAQNNYFEKPIINEQGIYRYKYINGCIVAKTTEEIQTELDTIVAVPQPASIEQRIADIEELMAAVMFGGAD